MPLARNAVTLSRCQVSRSSRTRMAILVSNCMRSSVPAPARRVLYVLHVTGADLRAWAPGVPGIAEVFHARFTDHAYPVHPHDAWTVLVVDQGMIRYDLHRHEH